MADNVSRRTRANILKSRISIGCEVVNHPIGVYYQQIRHQHCSRKRWLVGCTSTTVRETV